MAELKKIVQTVLSDLEIVLEEVDYKDCDELIHILVEAYNNNHRIFCVAAGRSLLIIKTFAMRLMHLGFQAHVVGEISTPALTSKDILLIGSGSGETSALKIMSKKAKSIGSRLILITRNRDSGIALNADKVIYIPIGRVENNLQPSGSIFEQSMMILLDSLVLKLINEGNFQKDKTIDELIMIRHANLE